MATLIQDLKTSPEFFQLIWDGKKTAEIRSVADRQFPNELVDRRHIGIRLLACAGMIAKSSRYPVMHRWFWHDRDKLIRFDQGLIDAIASNGLFGHSDRKILGLL